MNLRRFLQGSATDLAAFRITVFAVVLLSRDVWEAPGWASAADAVREGPAGWSWIAPWLPMSRAWASGALLVLVPAAAMACVGLFTRASSIVATIALGYLLLVPQFVGTVMHTHHLLWFSALLAASPCGDAWSLDSLRWRSPRPAPALAYGLPIRVAWLLVGMIFLFPGLWKWSVGTDWAWGGVLRSQLAWKWAEFGGTRTLLPIDAWPGALELGGTAVMAFELLALPGLLWKRSRLITVAAALLFHAATSIVFGISFSSLWACYLVFVPWTQLLARFERQPTRVIPVPRAWIPGAVVALLLVTGNAVAGALAIQNAFPFACYPTFHTRAPDEIPALELEGDVAGRVVQVDLARGASQREWGMLWRLALKPDRARLERFASVARSRWPELSSAERVRVYRSWRSATGTFTKPLRRELLWTSD
ncbi:MAG: HTTM domain-containing protein [Myxococcaceae bacterium]